MKLSAQLHKGFTLIELLVVIAVIGVLAVVLLVAIDPIEKINQASDSGVKSSVGQVSKATLAYGVNHDNTYPAKTGNSCGGSGVNVGWMQCLIDAGEIKTSVSAFTDGAATLNYDFTGSPATTFNLRAPLKSKTERSRATTTAGSVNCNIATNPTAWLVYSSNTGNTVFVCTTGPTVAPAYI